MIKKVVTVILIIVATFISTLQNKNESFDKDTIKVANWNVQNLFDLNKDGSEYKEYIPNQHNWNRATFNKKIKNLSEVICDLNADVIGLEEVESDVALEELQKFLKRAGCEYKYRAITNSKKTAVHTALLSKIPIKSKKDIRVGRRGLYRSILEVTLKTEPPLKIFVNHWSSKRHPESKRVTYAKALKERLKSLPKDSEYIILGDFNSNYDEYLSFSDDKRLNNTDGKTGINHILETIHSNSFVRLSYFKKVDRSSKLYNLWLELPKSDRWSYKYYRKRYSLDSILIPASMMNDKGWEYVEDSFKVFRPKYMFTKRGAVFKWQYKHKHLGKGYSDHFPIYALFKRVSKENKDLNKSQALNSGNTELNLNSLSLLNQSQKVMGENSSIAHNIENLLKGILNFPVNLNNVAVIFKRSKGAIIKEKPEGLGIMIYGGVKELEIGGVYNLKVYKTKNYYGTLEIIDFDLIKKIGRLDITDFIEDFKPSLMEGENLRESRVVKNIEGFYDNGTIEIAGKKFKIYFRGRGNRPKNGSKLIIKIAQIGYYKGEKELIVWSKNDYLVTTNKTVDKEIVL